MSERSLPDNMPSPESAKGMPESSFALKLGLLSCNGAAALASFEASHHLVGHNNGAAFIAGIFSIGFAARSVNVVKDILGLDQD